MKTFKIGDNVRILPRKEGQSSKSPGYTKSMTTVSNSEIFTIKSITLERNYKFGGIIGSSWRGEWLKSADVKRTGLLKLL